MTDTDRRRPDWKKLVLPIAVGGLAGFLGSFTFLQLTDFDPDSGLSHSREIAGLVAVIYAITGVGVLFGVLRPTAGARILNVEDADELREQKQQLTFSSLAMIALGAALAALALAGPGLALGGAAGAGLAVALILLATGLSLAMARHTDELQRALSKDAVNTAFYLLFFLGCGWALLAHTGLAVAPAPLDWITMFAASLLVGAFWQVARRGMLLRGPN